MKRLSLFLSLGLLFTSFHAAQAGIIYESGTLGETGIPFSDLANKSVPGTNVGSTIYTGVRFELSQPVSTLQVGGHFVARGNNGTFFGAIIKLDSESDFPDSGDFSTPDLIGETSLTFPALSDEVFGNLDLYLEPGWYALVFGSGLFGTEVDGAAVRNGTDIGDPTYIGFQPGSGVGWYNLAGFQQPFDNHRFLIRGTVVPEPSTIGLILLASFLIVSYGTFNRLEIRS